MIDERDKAILHAWTVNADAWTHAVRSGTIAPRERATNAAIRSVMRQLKPRSVVDLGCGEGWLCRALAREGIRATGVDAIPALIEQARRADPCSAYHCATYDELATLRLQTDVVVFNFSLFAEALSATLRAARALLGPDGVIVVQTLHPWFAGVKAYRDGWHTEHFEEFGGAFKAGMPWYFRTLTSWHEAFANVGLVVREVCEPLDVTRALPLSVIFVCR